MKTLVYRDSMLLCLGVLFISLILKLAGVTDFDMPLIDSALNNNEIVINIVYYLLFIANGLIMLKTIVKTKLTKFQRILFLIVISFLYLISLFLNLGYFNLLIFLSFR